MSAAPLDNIIAEGPTDGRAEWLKTSDGVRIRVAVWHAEGPRGTVFVLPGRTEYVEKYGRAAAVLAEAGYATLSIDWRGQGLADRALDDAMVGHVGNFAEYQLDMQAALGFARAEGLPEPYYMMAHSMGGCIGLRSLMTCTDFAAAAFSAPMWGILMAAWMRPLAVMLAGASHWLGYAGRYAPGTGPSTYVLDAPFAGNTLTTDAEMWDYMRRQAIAQPGLSLGGPSMAWLDAALAECHALSLMASPGVPAVCTLGLQERIVDVAPIHLRMAQWRGGRLDLAAAAEHEVMMERPATRAAFFDKAIRLFEANR